MYTWCLLLTWWSTVQAMQVSLPRVASASSLSFINPLVANQQSDYGFTSGRSQHGHTCESKSPLSLTSVNGTPTTPVIQSLLKKMGVLGSVFIHRGCTHFTMGFLWMFCSEVASSHNFDCMLWNWQGTKWLALTYRRLFFYFHNCWEWKKTISDWNWEEFLLALSAHKHFPFSWWHQLCVNLTIWLWKSILD